MSTIDLQLAKQDTLSFFFFFFFVRSLTDCTEQTNRCPDSEHEEQGLNAIDTTFLDAGKRSANALEGGEGIVTKS